MTGPLHIFDDYKEDTNNISLVGRVKGRGADFRTVMYHRTLADPLTLKLVLRSPGWDDIIVRKITGFVGTDWVFGDVIPLRGDESMVFTTSGAQAGEKQHGQMRFEEMPM